MLRRPPLTALMPARVPSFRKFLLIVLIEDGHEFCGGGTDTQPMRPAPLWGCADFTNIGNQIIALERLRGALGTPSIPMALSWRHRWWRITRGSFSQWHDPRGFVARGSATLTVESMPLLVDIGLSGNRTMHGSVTDGCAGGVGRIAFGLMGINLLIHCSCRGPLCQRCVLEGRCLDVDLRDCTQVNGVRERMGGLRCCSRARIASTLKPRTLMWGTRARRRKPASPSIVRSIAGCASTRVGAALSMRQRRSTWFAPRI
jgi:hypothetical protein